MVDRSAPTIPAPPASASTTDAEAEAGPSSSRVLALRPGLQILLGRPVRVDGGWQCTGKLMGRPGALPRLDEHDDDTPHVWAEERSTETLLLRVGSGATAEEAERDLVRQLKHIAGATLPPPALTITLVTHVTGPSRSRRRFSPP